MFRRKKKDVMPVPVVPETPVLETQTVSGGKEVGVSDVKTVVEPVKSEDEKVLESELVWLKDEFNGGYTAMNPYQLNVNTLLYAVWCELRLLREEQAELLGKIIELNK